MNVQEAEAEISLSKWPAVYEYPISAFSIDDSDKRRSKIHILHSPENHGLIAGAPDPFVIEISKQLKLGLYDGLSHYRILPRRY